jgi:hypothetical protein
MAEGLRYADRGIHERKVLIVVSDGGDNASGTAFDNVVRAAQRSNVLIYGSSSAIRSSPMPIRDD